uniref:Putative secreted protein n=1 Tax=Anopheles darlingi TaxID=43151 RepID=A0A2M4DPM6_ANODA
MHGPVPLLPLALVCTAQPLPPLSPPRPPPACHTTTRTIITYRTSTSTIIRIISPIYCGRYCCSRSNTRYRRRRRR